MVIHFGHAIEEKKQTEINREASEKATPIDCQIRSFQAFWQEKSCQEKSCQEKTCSKADSIEGERQDPKQSCREFRE